MFPVRRGSCLAWSLLVDLTSSSAEPKRRSWREALERDET
jgi:hypothetical protein